MRRGYFLFAPAHVSPDPIDLANSRSHMTRLCADKRLRLWRKQRRSLMHDSFSIGNPCSVAPRSRDRRFSNAPIGGCAEVFEAYQSLTTVSRHQVHLAQHAPPDIQEPKLALSCAVPAPPTNRETALLNGELTGTCHLQHSKESQGGSSVFHEACSVRQGRQLSVDGSMPCCVATLRCSWILPVTCKTEHPSQCIAARDSQAVLRDGSAAVEEEMRVMAFPNAHDEELTVDMTSLQVEGQKFSQSPQVVPDSSCLVPEGRRSFVDRFRPRNESMQCGQSPSTVSAQELAESPFQAIASADGMGDLARTPKLLEGHAISVPHPTPQLSPQIRDTVVVSDTVDMTCRGSLSTMSNNSFASPRSFATADSPEADSPQWECLESMMTTWKASRV